VQEENLQALNILVAREAEGFFTGAGRITRDDLPLLYAIREGSSYRLNRRERPKAEHGTNLSSFMEELKQRVDSLNTIPQISVLVALDFWEFMESDDVMRKCSKCHKIFTTKDSRNLYCSAKCFQSSRREYNARSERDRTRTRLLNPKLSDLKAVTVNSGGRKARPYR